MRQVTRDELRRIAAEAIAVEVMGYELIDTPVSRLIVRAGGACFVYEPEVSENLAVKLMEAMKEKGWRTNIILSSSFLSRRFTSLYWRVDVDDYSGKGFEGRHDSFVTAVKLAACSAHVGEQLELKED